MVSINEKHGWDGWQMARRRGRRSYLVCGGCEASWIWTDRVSDSRWKCDKWHTPWPQTTWSPTWRQHRFRKDKTVLVDRPPGLGQRQKGSPVETALKKGWTGLSKDVQEALKVVGIDYTPEPELLPLEVILQATWRCFPKRSRRRASSQRLLQLMSPDS